MYESRILPLCLQRLRESEADDGSRIAILAISHSIKSFRLLHQRHTTPGVML
jgi:hypothetical protein